MVRKTKHAAIHRVVERAVEKMDGEFVIHDIRRKVKKSKAEVRSALTRLERIGMVEKVGSRPTGGRGRPMAVYKKASSG